MHTATRKEVLTTGEVAKICHVAPRTVSKWFDTGKLRGYRIPGSRDRRIPVDQLIAFMRMYSIPLDGLDGGTCRVLIVDVEAPEELIDSLGNIERYEVMTACNGFDAGVVAQRFRPHIIVLDTSEGEREAASICLNVKQHPELSTTKVVAATDDLDEGKRQRLIGMGFDDCLAKPYSLRQLIETVEDVTSLVR